MNHEKPAAALAFVAMLIALTSCSKSTVNVGRENPEQSRVSPGQFVQPSQAHQIITERIAEIDRILAAPLTGTPEDSDRRVALRAERNALAGNHTLISNQSSNPSQNVRADSQAGRDHQQLVDKLKADAERSKIAEQRQLQAQRDQWDKEDRLSLRRQNGDFHPEAPPQNVYDIQVRSQRSRVIQPVYP